MFSILHKIQFHGWIINYKKSLIILIHEMMRITRKMAFEIFSHRDGVWPRDSRCHKLVVDEDSVVDREAEEYYERRIPTRGGESSEKIFDQKGSKMKQAKELRARAYRELGLRQ